MKTMIALATLAAACLTPAVAHAYTCSITMKLPGRGNVSFPVRFVKGGTASRGFRSPARVTGSGIRMRYGGPARGVAVLRPGGRVEMRRNFKTRQTARHNCNIGRASRAIRG